MGGGVGGWYAKSFSCLTQLKVKLGWVELWLSWGFDNDDNDNENNDNDNNFYNNNDYNDKITIIMIMIIMIIGL